MPDQKQNPTNDKLEERIDQLVNEMSDATQKLREQVSHADLSDADFDEELGIASALSPDEVLAKEPAEVEAKLEADAEPETEAESQTEPESAPEKQAEVEPEDEAPVPLDEQVEDMLVEVTSEEDSGDQLATELQEKTAVDRVDEELSELADEMLDGDFDDGDDILSAGDTPAPKPDTQPASVDAYGGEDDLEGDFDDADDVMAAGEPASAPVSTSPVGTLIEPNDAGTETPESISAAEPEVESESATPAPEPTAAADVDPESSEAEALDPDDAPAKPARTKQTIEPKTDTKLPRVAAVALAHVQHASLVLAERVNKPFDEKPPHVRDLAGWLAAVTLFNAIAIWVFMLLGRSPAPGTSTEPNVDLVGTGQQTAQVEPEPTD